MAITQQWWKEAVIYQIYPRSFKDSNGDGIGDLRGIIEKLDYLKSLGVDVLWLSPIYQSPNDDNGYDISDYYNIMTDFGTMDDFNEMLEGIHQRGMKLLMDLVVNHSSDEHKWFTESRKSKDNPYRDYYYWQPPKADGSKPTNWKSFFGGDAWDYDEQTGEYYLHLFTKKQPDLNWENPKVRQEVYKIIRYWLDKGVDGFRMDVIPFISKRLPFEDVDSNRGFNDVVINTYANGPRLHEFLQEMVRESINQYDVMTVGEGIGVTPQNGLLYVGEDRGELNMVFHFEHMFINQGKGGKFDIVDFQLTDLKQGFSIWDEALGEKGWVNIYLDNHDFPRMVSRFGNDGKYHTESAKLLATLLLTLRGTPCIYQGSEIGMTNVAFPSIEDYRDVETLNFYEEAKERGEDMEAFLKAVHIQGRDNVRTPVQWSNELNAGFTTGTPWIKANPNYPKINAEAVLKNTNSIWHYYQQMLQFRKTHLDVLVYGDYEVIDEANQKVYAYKRSIKGKTMIVVLNFTSEHIAFEAPYEVDELQYLKGNYKGKIEGEEGTVLDLRPWEARVYLSKV
ncbi:MAG: glycoside hydrolase family 13 protein [Chitinophagales bacterium]